MSFSVPEFTLKKHQQIEKRVLHLYLKQRNAAEGISFDYWVMHFRICIMYWETEKLPFIRYPLSLQCFYREKLKSPGSCKLDAYIRLETLAVPSNASHGLLGEST